MEIPTKVDFDFLLVLLGLGLMVFPFYTTTELGKLAIPIFFAGIVFFAQGLYYLYRNYSMNYELRQCEYAKQKQKYIIYLRNNRIISKDRKEELLKELRKTLKDE